MAIKKGKPSRREFLRHSARIGSGLVTYFSVSTAQSSHKHSSISRADIVKAVDLAVANVIADGLDDVFPRPFEVDMLASDDALRREVSSAAIRWLQSAGSDQPISAAYAIAIPKRYRGEYRNCALIDPLASICYLTLAILIAEATAQQRSSAACSYRFYGRESQLFDPKFNSEEFQNVVLSKLPEQGRIWLVHADIKEFYSSIGLERLRRALHRQNVEQRWTDAVLEMLSAWGGSIGGGIPTGPAASHVLAETLLIDIDRGLADDGIDHVRFVDDYRMFAPDLATAQAWIESLARRLGAEGLRLRSDKMSIDPVSRSAYASTLKWRGSGLSLAEIDQSPQPKQPPQPPPRCPPSGCQRPRRPPPRADIERLRRIDTDLLWQQLGADGDVDLADFRLFIEAAYWRGEFPRIHAAADLLDQSPHCIPYFVDLLLQEGVNLSASIRASIAARMGMRLNSGNPLTDLEVIKVARLLGCEAYKNQPALLAHLQDMPPGRSPIATRYLLEALAPGVSPQTAAQLAVQFGMASSWERRAILRLQTIRPGEHQSAAVAKIRQSLKQDPFSRAPIASPNRFS
jgi:Reverse transcriptase (RNA-dependent DNA polymerase)